MDILSSNPSRPCAGLETLPSSPTHQALVSILGQFLLNSLIDTSLCGFRKLPPGRLLPLVIRRTLDLSPLLKSVSCQYIQPPRHVAFRFIIPCDNVLIFPANLVAQSSDGTVFSPWFQPQYSQSLWHNHSLLLVVWWWDSLEDLKSLHSRRTSSSLVWNHAADCLVENAGRSTEMEGTTSCRVETGDLSEVCMVLDCNVKRYH
jgi:hypothetical protein